MAAEARFIVLGASAAVGSFVGGVVETTAIAADTVSGIVSGFVPAAARRPVAVLAGRLDAQGRDVAASVAARARELADELAANLAAQPLVVRTVEQVVAAVQWDVVDSLLPGVLERLAAEPEKVRVIVRGQSRSMGDEVARSARTRAAAGDDAVDRAVRRLLHRRSPVTPTPLTQPSVP